MTHDDPPAPHKIGLELGEAICPDCGRHVMDPPRPAMGWLAKCGRRITRLDEVGKAEGICRDKGEE